jgi:hypothetical protein
MALYQDIRKNKLMALTNAVCNFLKNVDIDDIIDQLFIKSDNPLTWELIKKFEGVVLNCKLHPERAIKDVRNFLISNTEFIKKNNLYRDFLDFYYLVYINCHTKGIDNLIFPAYLSIVLEQANYLSEEGKMLVGLHTDGTLITLPDTYPNLEKAVIEFYSKIKSHKASTDQLNTLRKSYKKYGFDVKNPNDISLISNNEQAVSNEFHSLMSIVDEDYVDMLPIPHYEPYPVHITPIRQWFGTDKYIEHLRERKYILPSKGVTCVFKNAGNIQEITFREKCLEDKIIMLYKVKMDNNKYISGFYDNKLEFFNDIWKGSGRWQTEVNTVRISNMFENFILEVYAHLTTGMEVIYKKNAGILIVEDMKNTGFYFDTQPVMQIFKLNSKVEKGSGERVFERRPFSKSEYIAVEKTIQPLKRKLPEGAKASTNAMKLAKSLGYTLEEGETFVGKFTKSVRVTKKD